jgi:hypothetical protein
MASAALDLCYLTATEAITAFKATQVTSVNVVEI